MCKSGCNCTYIFTAPPKYTTPSSTGTGASNEGWLSTTLKLMHLAQMCVQGRWISDSSLLILPHIDHTHIEMMKRASPKMTVTKECDVVK